WEEDGIVHLADYKFAAPSTFLELLGKNQLAFYGAVASRLFPGRTIDLSLVFLKESEGRLPFEGFLDAEAVETRVRAMARAGWTGPFARNPRSCPACPWREPCGESAGSLE
ncbi:MAG TPA: hypothetical protein PLY83_03625, partial [Synergistales bacterium]|nr:hypothetical protein [Synergistales bacterium]